MHRHSSIYPTEHGSNPQNSIHTMTTPDKTRTETPYDLNALNLPANPSSKSASFCFPAPALTPSISSLGASFSARFCLRSTPALSANLSISRSTSSSAPSADSDDICTSRDTPSNADPANLKSSLRATNAFAIASVRSRLILLLAESSARDAFARDRVESRVDLAAARSA